MMLSTQPPAAAEIDAHVASLMRLADRLADRGDALLPAERAVRQAYRNLRAAAVAVREHCGEVPWVGPKQPPAERVRPWVDTALLATSALSLAFLVARSLSP
jgi:hypothetical protein